MTDNGESTALIRREKDVHDLLVGRAEDIADAIPARTREDQERIALRIVKLAAIAARGAPKLLKCSDRSLLLAVLEAGQLGLEPNGIMGGGWLIPRWNKNRDGQGRGGHEAHFQIGYKGMINLACRGGNVARIEAREVWNCDDFDFELGLDPILKHKPHHEPRERNAITWAYMIAIFRDGSKQFEVMSWEQIEDIRAEYASDGSKAWEKHPDMMARKTVVRRGMNYLNLSPETRAAVGYDDLVTIGQGQRLAALDPHFGPDEWSRAIAERTGSNADAIRGRLEVLTSADPEVVEALETAAEAAEIDEAKAEAPTDAPEPSESVNGTSAGPGKPDSDAEAGPALELTSEDDPDAAQAQAADDAELAEMNRECWFTEGCPDGFGLWRRSAAWWYAARLRVDTSHQPLDADYLNDADEKPLACRGMGKRSQLADLLTRMDAEGALD